MELKNLEKYIKMSEKLIEIHDVVNLEYETDIYLVGTIKTKGKPKNFSESDIIYHAVKIK